MNITKEELAEITKFASAGISIHEVAIILEKPCIEFKKQAEIEGTEINLAYLKGELLIKYELNESIIRMAKRGSNPAQLLAKKILEEVEIKNQK